MGLDVVILEVIDSLCVKVVPRVGLEPTTN